MIKTVDIKLSPQAKLILSKMHDVDVDAFIDWYVTDLCAGGADLITYLEYLEKRKQ